MQDLQRQLESTQKAAEAEKVRVTENHQRQLDHVQKTAESNSERTRKRTEAEISDLKNSVSKLEADLEKVCLVFLKCTHHSYTNSQRQIRTTCKISKQLTTNTQPPKPNKLPGSRERKRRRKKQKKEVKPQTKRLQRPKVPYPKRRRSEQLLKASMMTC